MDNLFTTEAAAEYLAVSKARVRKLINEGRLPAHKRGRDHILTAADLQSFALNGRKKTGRPRKQVRPGLVVRENQSSYPSSALESSQIGLGEAILGNCVTALKRFDSQVFQAIIADPPYFQVLLDHDWDNTWKDADEYLEWTLNWVKACKRVLRADGLLYVFGQLGKREHVWLHTCSTLAKEMQFHDMLIWDRAVGYNERYDSFTPQYEMVLVLRHTANSKPFFDKNAVRLPYDEQTIQAYLRDKRYKDKTARETHLRKGKYATNIIRIPSLKGSSNEKIGHPSQKPISLIKQLVAASTKPNDLVLDPFLGSGTTAEACESLKRRWVGIELNREYYEMSLHRIESLLIHPELVMS